MPTATAPATQTLPADESLAGTDFTIAGRTFRPAVPLSAWQVGYYGAHLRAAKGTALVAASQDGDTGAFDELVDRLMGSLHLYHMIAASHVEVLNGAPLAWSDVAADRNAQFFAGLTDPADIIAIRDGIFRVLAGFFPRGPRSSATSPNSSSSPAPAAANRKRPRRRSATAPSGSTSGSGDSSPDGSAARTTT